MELKPLFFILAVTAALCIVVNQAHKVPQPYEESLAKIADKYEKPQKEMWNYIQTNKNIKDIERKSLGIKRALSIRSGRNNHYWQIVNGTEIKCSNMITLDVRLKYYILNNTFKIQWRDVGWQQWTSAMEQYRLMDQPQVVLLR